ncbi:amine oxidase [flavin-containing]-like isoform X2 [Tachypleus tridentatus]|uniref:amine oxidase [flavin-containing]-like isoform X2 n=1 Tax=Tachypleus tridentatus TaxID=6853 RepID=UPI003FD372C6
MGAQFPYSSQWAKFGLRSPLAWLDITYVMKKMDKIMEQIPREEPWMCQFAQEWDDITLNSFLEKECWTKYGKEFIKAVMQANLSADPSQVSLLWSLWYVKCCDGQRRIWNVENGAQERKFWGGAVCISEALVEHLKEKVLLNSQVYELKQSDTDVTITTTDGRSYRAKYLIMAIPLPLQMKLHYDPPLPPLRNQLIQRAPVGCVIKAIVYYKKPFWRVKGFNGFVACRDGQLVLGNVLDDCRDNFPLAALTVFVFGDHAIEMQDLSKEERMKIITQDLAKAYGCDECLQPIHYEEKNWLEEQYSGGCYVSTFPPGVLSRYGRTIRKPFNLVYFGGTETATSWPGYMNGAVQAGERAAREVLYAMGLTSYSSIWKEEPEIKEVPAKPFQLSFIERHPPSFRTIISFISLSTAGCISATCFFLYRYLNKS